MRSLLLIVLLSGWMQAIDLTATTPFATTEEVPFEFTMQDLKDHCTTDVVPDRFIFDSIGANGTLQYRMLITDAWTTLGASGQVSGNAFFMYTPNTNAAGTKVLATIRAALGADISDPQSVNVVLAGLPDPITAVDGIFTQPTSGPQVTEDTTYTFTAADLIATLNIREPDAQAFKLVITSLVSGSLAQQDGTPITTLPYDLATTGSIQWRAAPYAFTKTGEPPITAFTVKAVNTVAPLDETPVVAFSTYVVGVTNTPTEATTLTGFDTLTVTRGDPSTFTFSYAQLRAKEQGSNDWDRNGVMYFNFTTGANGLLVRVFDVNGQFRSGASVFPNSVSVWEGESLQVVVPDSHPAGTSKIAEIAIEALGAPTFSAFRDVTLQVVVPGSTGTTTNDAGSDGGGGGCGMGATGAILGCACLGLLPLRRRKRPC